MIKDLGVKVGEVNILPRRVIHKAVRDKRIIFASRVTTDNR